MNLYFKIGKSFLVLLLTLYFALETKAQNNNCQSTLPWTNYNVYLQGDRIKYNGVLYKVKWWVQNQIPSNDPNGPYIVLGICTDNSTIHDNCSSFSNWANSTVYMGGEIVVYNGNVYRARNYTQAQIPGFVNTPWDLQGICDQTSLPANNANGQPIAPTTWSFNGNNNTDNSNFIGTTIAQPLIFRANNIEGIRINASGSIQMGSQRVLSGHQDFKLSVDGKLVCQKIIATTHNWADTVFSEGYEPMNLNLLETYIKENKHLPEIPGEQDVLKKGVDLIEMNMLLLKKMEEMTLYIIDLEKRIKFLEIE